MLSVCSGAVKKQVGGGAVKSTLTQLVAQVSLLSSWRSKMMTSAGHAVAHPKPPNVLIYQDSKDPTSKEFLRAKESLEFCLAPEHYVLYPLGGDDVTHHTPWKDNCRLLVLPPSPPNSVGTVMSSRVIEEVLSYVQRGGNLLSMQPELNKLLGLRPLQECLTETVVSEDREKMMRAYCRDQVCSVEVPNSNGTEQNHRFSALVPDFSGTIVDHSNSVYLDGLPLKKLVLNCSNEAHLVPLEWSVDEQWLNTNQSNNNDIELCGDLLPNLPILPCVQKVTLTGGGQAIVSSVDLFSSLPEGLGLSPLLRLKEGVALRGRLLSKLLRGLGLKCSAESLPELTHTYLLAEEQVKGP